MFAMFKSLFASIETLCDALNLFAGSAKNIGQWTIETSGEWVDESKVQRELKRQQSAKKLGVKS